MKTGISINELATQVKANRARIRDFDVDTRSLAMDPASGRFTLSARENEVLTVDGNSLFHSQVADRLGIPSKYYDRMREQEPGLLAQNVNTWLHDKPERRLVRTYSPQAASPAMGVDRSVPSLGRAFLSDRYRPLDNFAMMEAILPPLFDSGLTVASSQITDERLYLQLVTEKIQAEICPNEHVRVNDPVQLGLVVSNSETGCGALTISLMVYRLVCRNGLIVAEEDSGFRKAHLGGRIFAESDVYLTQATRQKKDDALWSEARDVITAGVTQANLDRLVKKIEGVAQVKLDDPVKTVELVSDRYGFNDDERDSIMKHLISGGDPTKWGLVNAITRTAEDAPSYDRAIELEAIGGKYMMTGNN